jgi:lysophospholipase L1-like esterase
MNARLLMPLAIVQGLWVLQRTPRLPAPSGNSGRLGVGLGTPLKVAGLGDSIMVGTGVRDQCHSLTATYARLLHERLVRDVEWRVHGFNGATSADVLHKLSPGVQCAHVYIISCGVNDATRGVPVSRFAENLAQILQSLRRKSPRATILYGGLPPLDSFPALPWPLKAILAEQVNQMQVAAAGIVARDERAHCFYFPSSMPAEQFASDGFHPAEQACERWANGLLDLWPPTVTPVDRTVRAARPARSARSRRTSARDGEPLPVVQTRRHDPCEGDQREA